MSNIATPEQAAAPPPTPERLRIGEVSRLYHVTPRALRFYEDRGLLEAIRTGKARYYGPSEQARLQVILEGKHFGFTLAEIAGMLRAKTKAAGTSGVLATDEETLLSQLQYLRQRRAELDEMIEDLRTTLKKRFGGAK